MNLPDGDQVRHAVEVIGNKLAIASRFDSLPSFVNLSSQFVLSVTVLGQLPESKGQLKLCQASPSTNSIWELTVCAVVM